MNRRPLLVTSLALLAPLPALAAQEPTRDVAPEMASLVPADTIAFVHVDALASLDADLERMNRKMGRPTGPTESLRAMLAMLPLDASLIDVTQPMSVAFAIDQSAGEPKPTVIVSSSDPDALIASAEVGPGMPRPRRVGTYVAFPMGVEYQPAARPPAIVTDLPLGDFVVRVDLATIVSTFETEIQGALTQAEFMAQGMAGATELEGLPFEPEAFVTTGLSAARTVVESVETLDLAFGFDGSVMDLHLGLVAKEGSALAALASHGGGDPGRLLALLPEDAMMRGLAAVDLRKMHNSLSALTEPLMSELPAETRGVYEGYVWSFQHLYGQLGDEMAMSAQMGEGGMEFTYAFGSEDPEADASAFADRLVEIATATDDLRFVGPTERVVDGVQVREFELGVGIQQMNAAFLDGAPVDTDAFDNWLQAIHGGSDMRLSVATSDDALVVTVGGDLAVERDVAALRGAGSAAGPLADLSQRIRGAHPSFLGEVDMRQLLVQSLAFGDAMVPGGLGVPPLSPAITEGAPVAMHVYGGMRGRALFGGMRLDLESMVELSDALNAGY